MNRETVHIKHMVCPRCIMVVRGLLAELKIEPLDVQLGEVTLKQKLTGEQQNRLAARLTDVGFELIDDKRTQIVEKIKNSVIELVHHADNNLKTNLSDYLTEKIPHHTYHYLSNLFSETEQTTIEKYFIAQKIERVKELLAYDELTLSEIADKLNYSSTAHLSSQFRKITGLTPTQFKAQKDNHRTPLNEI